MELQKEKICQNFEIEVTSIALESSHNHDVDNFTAIDADMPPDFSHNLERKVSEDTTGFKPPSLFKQSSAPIQNSTLFNNGYLPDVTWHLKNMAVVRIEPMLLDKTSNTLFKVLLPLPPAVGNWGPWEGASDGATFSRGKLHMQLLINLTESEKESKTFNLACEMEIDKNDIVPHIILISHSLFLQKNIINDAVVDLLKAFGRQLALVKNVFTCYDAVYFCGLITSLLKRIPIAYQIPIENLLILLDDNVFDLSSAKQLFKRNLWPTLALVASFGDIIFSLSSKDQYVLNSLPAILKVALLNQVFTSDRSTTNGKGSFSDLRKEALKMEASLLWCSGFQHISHTCKQTMGYLINNDLSSTSIPNYDLLLFSPLSLDMDVIDNRTIEKFKFDIINESESIRKKCDLDECNKFSLLLNSLSNSEKVEKSFKVNGQDILRIATSRGNSAFKELVIVKEKSKLSFVSLLDIESRIIQFINSLDRAYKEWSMKQTNLCKSQAEGWRITPFAGTSSAPGFEDGKKAKLRNPNNVVHVNGLNYIIETHNHSIRRVNIDGSVETLIGRGGKGNADGDSEMAKLCSPSDAIMVSSIEQGGENGILIVDKKNGKLKYFSIKSNLITTIMNFVTSKDKMSFNLSSICVGSSEGEIFAVDDNKSSIVLIPFPSSSAKDASLKKGKGVEMVSKKDKVGEVKVVIKNGPTVNDGMVSEATCKNPTDIKFNKVNNTLYWTESKSSCLRSLNLSTNEVTTLVAAEMKTIGKLSLKAVDCPADCDFQGFDISNDGKFIYICDNKNNKLLLYSVSENSLTTVADIQGIRKANVLPSGEILCSSFIYHVIYKISPPWIGEEINHLSSIENILVPAIIKSSSVLNNTMELLKSSVMSYSVNIRKQLHAKCELMIGEILSFSESKVNYKIREDVLSTIVFSMPNISSLKQLFYYIRVNDPGAIPILSNQLVLRLSNYIWPEDLESIDSEWQALGEMLEVVEFRERKLSVIDVSIICEILRNENTPTILNTQFLLSLFKLLSNYGYQVKGPLALGIGVFCRRKFNFSDEMDHFSKIKELIDFYECYFSNLNKKEIHIDSKNDDVFAQVYKSSEWIAQIHLTSVLSNESMEYDSITCIPVIDECLNGCSTVLRKIFEKSILETSNKCNSIERLFDSMFFKCSSGLNANYYYLSSDVCNSSEFLSNLSTTIVHDVTPDIKNKEILNMNDGFSIFSKSFLGGLGKEFDTSRNCLVTINGKWKVPLKGNYYFRFASFNCIMLLKLNGKAFYKSSLGNLRSKSEEKTKVDQKFFAVYDYKQETLTSGTYDVELILFSPSSSSLSNYIIEYNFNPPADKHVASLAYEPICENLFFFLPSNPKPFDNQDKQSVTSRNLYHMLVISVLDRLLSSGSIDLDVLLPKGGKAMTEKEIQEYEKKLIQMNKQCLNLMVQKGSGTIISKLIVWFTHEINFTKDHKFYFGRDSYFSEIDSILKVTFLSAADQINISILNEQITVDYLQRIEMIKKECVPAWLAQEHRIVCDAFGFLVDKLENITNKLTILTSFCKEFLPSSDETLLINNLNEDFKNLSLNKVMYIFRIPSVERSDFGKYSKTSASIVNVSGVKTLSSLLLNSINWCQRLRKGKLFKFLLNNECELQSRDTKHILEVSKKMSRIFAALTDESIKFELIDQCFSEISSTEELSLLFASCSESKFDVNSVWQFGEFSSSENKIWVDQALFRLNEWKKLNDLWIARKNISLLLPNLKVFIDDRADGDIDFVLNKISELENYISTSTGKKEYNEWTLGGMDVDIKNLVASVNPVFINMDLSLWKCISQNLDLLDWLRGHPSDQDWKNSIEISLSKSKLDCPPELWIDSSDDGRGRPDEKKLSMLTSIRNYLHSLIYNCEKVYRNLPSLIDSLLLINKKVDTVMMTNNINTVSTLLSPLSDLLADVSDDMNAVIRLIFFFDESAKAQWCATLNEKGEAYTSFSFINSSFQKQIWSTEELQEFQTKIILAESKGVSITEPLNKFIEQLDLCNQISKGLRSLFQAGHLDYCADDEIVKFDFLAVSDISIVRKKVAILSNSLHNWSNCILDLQLKYYFVNIFNIALYRRLLKCLVNFLDEEIEVDGSENTQRLMKTVQTLLSHINIDQSFNLSFVKSISSEIKNSFVSASKTNDLLTAENKLEAVVSVVDVIFINISSRVRKIKINEEDSIFCGIDKEVTSKSLVSKNKNNNDLIKLIVSGNKNNALIHDILTVFLRSCFLPEYETVMICYPSTTSDQVMSFILRWSKSTKYNRTHKTYVLAGINRLSFNCQSVVSRYIRDGLKEASCTLVMISSSTGSQHLVTSFKFALISSIELPANVISKVIGGNLSTTFSCGVSAVTSRESGIGKSFEIRKSAIFSDMNYHCIRINNSENLNSNYTSLLLQKIFQRGIDNNQKDQIHFDLSHQVNSSADPFLFGLIFCGVVKDSENEMISWNPFKTAFSLEVATSSLSPVDCSKYIPMYEISLSTISSDNKTLRAGMGENMYNEGGVDAEFRLQYVCQCLKLLEKNGFPHLPQVQLENKDYFLSGEDCQSLIQRFIGSNSTSKWNIWSFVNVLFNQLRELHSSGNPLNNACLVDPLSTKESDKEIKEAMKAEIIRFIIGTAKEFGCRQVKVVDEFSIASAQILYFNSNTKFNGHWYRNTFDVDGFPSFKSGHMFLYFRASLNLWVIDDQITPDRNSATYARSTNKSIHSPWVNEAVRWTKDNAIKVQVLKDSKDYPSAYKREVVSISGCINRGGSVTEKENGFYLRQPPYDDINKLPHYIKHNDTYRRHLFYSISDKAWKVCSVCTEDEGALMMSDKQSIDGIWIYTPADIPEPKVSIIFTLKNRKIAKFIKSKVNIKNQDGHDLGIITTTDGEEIETTVAPVSDEIKHAEIFMPVNLVTWNESNHESLLFNNAESSISFLSLNPKYLRENMHPGLLQFLQTNSLSVGEDLDVLSSKHYFVLSSLTGIKKSKAEAEELLGGFCLTGDGLLKMLAIYTRLKCNLPVVLLGECGCGKTFLIQYLCLWLGVKLLILDIHGGTEEEEVIAIFEKAEAILSKNETGKVYVFLDEINACVHMGIMNEILVQHSIRGNRLNANIHVLAALNPYRKRKKNDNAPGLIFNLNKNDTENNNNMHDDMQDLVYRVHPVPVTLQNFIFDFGILSSDQEGLYIESIILSATTKFKEVYLGSNVKFNNYFSSEIDVMVKCIKRAQTFIREIEEDVSSTSLRDVKRTSKLLVWFIEKIFPPKKFANLGTESSTEYKSFICKPFILALSFVYLFRLGTEAQRNTFQIAIQGVIRYILSPQSIKNIGWDKVTENNGILSIVDTVREKFCSSFEIDEGIAMNNALSENLFVTTVCVLNKIPCFIIGKPGTSKTLTMQILVSNLQGPQSPNIFFRNLPSVVLFQYQCSPMSTANAIRYQYNMAKRYSEQAHNCITILLLDEVGLAEHSPDMPLKVLHAMLTLEEVSVVGLSNWTLDPAKMNRTVCLKRTDPDQLDIHTTGQRIIGNENDIKAKALIALLKPLANAYHTVYTNQDGRDFIGMRDYYNLLRLLRQKVIEKGEVLDKFVLTEAICRNFGGKAAILSRLLITFHENCFKDSLEAIPEPTNILHLVNSNLRDDKSRHLMLLTQNSAAFHVIFGCGILNPLKTSVLSGSNFKDDQSELYLVQQINEVKTAMANGNTIVLINHDNIYEALYDVLNQRYVTKMSKNGKMRRLLRLAIGNKSQLCSVLEGFKIIVIVEETHAIENLDLPLLNRFEKQLLRPTDLLISIHEKFIIEMKSWIDNVITESGIKDPEDFLQGYYFESLSTLALQVLGFSNNTTVDFEEAINIAKKKLIQVASPLVVTLSSEILNIAYGQRYIENHNSLRSLLLENLWNKNESSMIQIMTASHYSSISSISLLKNIESEVDSKFATVVPLSNVLSEKMLKDCLKEFFDEHSKRLNSNCQSLLLFQCDLLEVSQNIINHSMRIATKMWTVFNKDRSHLDSTKCIHIVFLLHVQVNTLKKSYIFPLDFWNPWDIYFLDDLNVSDETNNNSLGSSISFENLFGLSLYDLFEDKYLDLKDLLIRFVNDAMLQIFSPIVNDAVELKKCLNQVEKMNKMKTLISEDENFINFMLKTIKTVLGQFRSVGKTGLHLHIEMILLKKFQVGTLRSSALFSVQNFVTKLMTIIFRFLDTDFGLQILLTSDKKKFFLELLKVSTVFDINVITTRFQQEVIDATDRNADFDMVSTNNAPSNEILIGRFPFSFKISSYFDTQEVKEQIFEKMKDLVEIKKENPLEVLSHAFFGNITKMSDWVNFSLDYLHDYVSIAKNRICEITFDEQYSITCSIITALYSNALSSPTSIHIAIWKAESLLFCIFNVMKISKLSCKKDIFKFICTIPSEMQNQIDSVSIISSEILLIIYNSLITKGMRIFKNLKGWMQEDQTIKPIIDGFVSILNDNEREKLYETDSTLRLLRIFALTNSSLCSSIIDENATKKKRVVEANFTGEDEEEDEGADENIQKSLPEKEIFLLFICSKEKPLNANSLHAFRSIIKHAFNVWDGDTMEYFLILYLSDVLQIYSSDHLRLFPLESTLWGALSLLVKSPSKSILYEDGNSIDLSFTIKLRKSILISLKLFQDNKMFFDLLESATDFSEFNGDGGGSQLLLQFYQDELFDSQNMALHDDLIANFFNIALSFYNNSSGISNQQKLYAVANTQRLLSDCSKDLINLGKFVNENAIASPLVREYLGSDTIFSNYLLSSIKRFGGYPAMDAIVSSGSEVLSKILQIKNTGKKNSAIQSFDGFSWKEGTPGLKLSYSTLREKVRTIAKNSAVLSEKVNISLNKLPLMLTIGCIFFEITLERDNSIRSSIEVLESIIMKNVPIQYASFMKYLILDSKVEKRAGSFDLQTETLIYQNIINFIAVSSRNSSNWISSLLSLQPNLNVFFISMPSSITESLVRGMGGVGWYKCSNGHLYTVGNCTMPMEIAKCPGCGVPIGGKDHNSVKGVTRLGNDFGGATPGYLDDAMNMTTKKFADCGDYSPLTTAVMRFILHGVLIICCQFNLAGVSFLLKLPKDRVYNVIQGRLTDSWNFMKTTTSLSDIDLSLCLHSVADKLNFFSAFKDMSTYENRLSIEADITRCVATVFTNVNTNLETWRKQVIDSDYVANLVNTFGSDRYNLIIESNTANLHSLLWRQRRVINFSSFSDTFSLDSVALKQYTILRKFIESEKPILLLKHIKHIFAWHAILFEVFPPSSLSREEAYSITNIDAINKLAEHKRSYAIEVLNNYCEGFNSAFPLVERLFECQDNPFLIPDNGGVDLSGNKGKGKEIMRMCSSTPVAFSIPSVHPSGETDAAGLCTIQLLNLLATSHNEVLQQIDKIKTTSNSQSGSTFLSYKTPMKQIDNAIIFYNREVLTNLINIHANQGLALQSGNYITFEWRRIEQGIINAVLAGKQQIVLMQRHYQFRGEIASNRKLQTLAARLPQVDLSEVLKAKIEADLDTRYKISNVSRYLEPSINFLCSFGIGGSNTNQMSFIDFCTNVLSISSVDFCASVPSTISKSVLLEHLASLSELIDELLNGDPCKRVALKYLQPLTDDILKSIKDVIPSLNAVMLIKTMKGFMIDQLSEDKWEAGSSLKDYLSYFDFDLSEQDWFDLIPQSIELQHSASFFKFLESYIAEN